MYINVNIFILKNYISSIQATRTNYTDYTFYKLLR